ncbi:MAG TPA: alpha/beta hydrolase-fold protein [Pirellulales bacterium]|nr:alpha/beta hydrolase-fold protein [Pirellulales bacterium]
MIKIRLFRESIRWIVMLLLFPIQLPIEVIRAEEPVKTAKESSNQVASDPQRQHVISIDPKLLDTYVGQYELGPNAILVLDRERQHLFAQITGQPRLEVFPESETKFFWKIVEAHFTIQQDEKGQVIGLVLGQGADKLTAKKISKAILPEEDFREPSESLKSPHLAALAKELKNGDHVVVEQFWKNLQEKAPLIEPIPDDPHDSWVTFVWRGNDKTHRVGLSGGLPTGEKDKPLAHLDGSDIWYRTERIPNDARFAYSFQINWPTNLPEDQLSQFKLMLRLVPKLDPLNPHEVTIQSSLKSLLEMPAAPHQPWLERIPEVPEGQLAERKFQSEILKQQRVLTVYTPAKPDSDAKKPGLLILFDGPSYESSDEIPGPTILDNLIDKGKIPPLVAVFVTHASQNRATELACSEPFADFIAKELVPWLQSTYHVSADPKNTIIGGLSQGGLMGAFCALRYPEVFGNVLSQSGSYQWFPGALGESIPPGAEPGWLTRQYAMAPQQPIRFYLEAGRFEDSFPFSLLAENRRFRDVLEAKGYAVQYSEFSGGHDYQTWRGTLADGLIALTAKPAQN